MSSLYYAGHDFIWMEKFLKSIPKNRKLPRCSAICLAEAIHHQFIYTKKQTFSLSHKTLRYFGLNRKCIKTYLLLFQEAGLIKAVFKRGSSPRVKLLLLPSNHYKINKHNIKEYIDRVQVSELGHDGVLTKTGDLSQQGQVVDYHILSKQTNKECSPVTKTRDVIN